jgi:hypothetical protein
MILISDTENEFEYLYIYCLSYFCNLRLCGNLSNLNMPFFISCFFLTCLIFLDISSNRNKKPLLVNYFLMLGSFSTTIYLDSILIYILFCLHFISPVVIFFINNTLRMNIRYIIYQTLFLSLFSFIGFRFFTSTIIWIYSYFICVIPIDIFLILQNIIHFRFIDEIGIIKFFIQMLYQLSIIG